MSQSQQAATVPTAPQGSNFNFTFSNAGMGGMGGGLTGGNQPMGGGGGNNQQGPPQGGGNQPIGPAGGIHPMGNTLGGGMTQPMGGQQGGPAPRLPPPPGPNNFNLQQYLGAGGGGGTYGGGHSTQPYAGAAPGQNTGISIVGQNGMGFEAFM